MLKTKQLPTSTWLKSAEVIKTLLAMSYHYHNESERTANTVYRRDGAISVQIASLDTYLFKRRSLFVVNNKTIDKGFSKVRQIITVIV